MVLVWSLLVGGYVLNVKERDPYLCAAGSFFFPGLGQVYSGRIIRGILFLIPSVILSVPIIVPVIHWISWYWTPIAKITDFIVRVIATYDAYRIGKSTKAPEEADS